MKTYLKVMLILFIFLISTCSITSKVFSLEQTLSIKTSKNNIEINDEFYIYFYSSKLDNLYSISLEFKYNPEILEILTIESGECFEEDKIESHMKISPISKNSANVFYYETLTGDKQGKTSDKQIEILKIKARLLKNSMVPLSIINDKNNLFIGTPNIRLIMADSNLNRNSFSSSTSYIKTSNFSSEGDIKSFVLNTYKKALLRDAEEYGLIYWFNKLVSQEYSVRDFLINILNENEFIEKKLSNEQFITSMYSIIANREPDEIGFKHWLTMLNEFQEKMNIKEAKSKIILLICNEAELEQRSNKLNLKF